jgi:hypothetical protein
MPKKHYFYLETEMLDGPISRVMTLDYQMIWWKLVAMAQLSQPIDGVIRYGRGPFIRQEAIAQRAGCSVIDLGAVIRAAGNNVKVWDDGTLQITNLEDYLPKWAVEPKPKQVDHRLKVAATPKREVYALNVEAIPRSEDYVLKVEAISTGAGLRP